GRLVAMGILPGAELELLQRFPAFVFRIGCAEFAVDAALAERIRVRRSGRRDFTKTSRGPHGWDGTLSEEPERGGHDRDGGAAPGDRGGKSRRGGVGGGVARA